MTVINNHDIIIKIIIIQCTQLFIKRDMQYFILKLKLIQSLAILSFQTLSEILKIFFES